jgi:hypothetical protein
MSELLTGTHSVGDAQKSEKQDCDEEHFEKGESDLSELCGTVQSLGAFRCSCSRFCRETKVALLTMWLRRSATAKQSVVEEGATSAPFREATPSPMAQEVYVGNSVGLSKQGASNEASALHGALHCRLFQSMMPEEVKRQSDIWRRPPLQHLLQSPGHLLFNFRRRLEISAGVAPTHTTSLEPHPIARPIPRRIPHNRLINSILATPKSQRHHSLHNLPCPKNRNPWPRLKNSTPSILVLPDFQRMQPFPVLSPVAARDLASFGQDVRRHHEAAMSRLPRLVPVHELVEDAALGKGHCAAVLADV